MRSILDTTCGGKEHFSSRCIPESASLWSLYVSVHPLSKGTKTVDSAGNRLRSVTGGPSVKFCGFLQMKNRKKKGFD